MVVFCSCSWPAAPARPCGLGHFLACFSVSVGGSGVWGGDPFFFTLSFVKLMRLLSLSLGPHLQNLCLPNSSLEAEYLQLDRIHVRQIQGSRRAVCFTTSAVGFSGATKAQSQQLAKPRMASPVPRKAK